MSIYRRIALFAAITGTLLFLGMWVPRFFSADGLKIAAISQSKNPSPGTVSGKAGEPTRDSLTESGLPYWQEQFLQNLRETLGIEAASLRQRRGVWQLTLPRGRPLQDYALEIELLARKAGLDRVEGREVRSNQVAEYGFGLGGAMLYLRLEFGAAYLPGTARLAIVFTGLDSLGESDWATMDKAPWKKNLVINPYSEESRTGALRHRAAHHELILELPMEPTAYPYVNPGKNALYIHFTQEEVDRTLISALEKLPAAKGFVSRFGDRAIEHRPLLEKLFRTLAHRNLLFIDLTESPRSLALQSAVEQGAVCKVAWERKRLDELEAEFNKKTIAAQKTGEAVMVVRYSPRSFAKLNTLYHDHLERLQTQGIALVKLSDMQ